MLSPEFGVKLIFSFSLERRIIEESFFDGFEEKNFLVAGNLGMD